jgi:hypothetical protein
VKLAGLVLLAAIASLLHVGSGASGGARQPARAQIVEEEFSLTLSRVRLKSGPAILEVANFGQDPHDLRVQRLGARHVAGTPKVLPSRRTELALNLPPGRYSLWCSIANHRQLGMRATLTVTR